VSLITLIRRHKPEKLFNKHRSGKEAPQRRPVPHHPQRIEPARIETIEEQLLAAAVDHHPRRERALDHLADDVAALSAEMERTRRGPLLLRSTASLNRMEELLLEAVVRTHPNRGRALDRLLDDVAGDGAIEPVPMAVIDPDFVDNDFDGMG
jgi:hypothetical protein